MNLVTSGIRVPRELHKRVKVESAQREQTIEEAYREALTSWLETQPGATSSSSELSAEELTLIELWRSKPMGRYRRMARRQLQDALDLLTIPDPE